MAQYETEKIWRTTKRGHVSKYLNAAKDRAKKQNLPFDLDLDFLISIALDECPVFKTPFIWGQSKGKHPYRPSLDRVIPELGYVKQNVVFISLKANVIKQDVAEKELYAVADWLHEKRKEVLNAQTNTAAPVSKGTYIQGAVGAELGSVSTPWTWEDNNHTDHHSGADARQDADHRAQASSGDGLGRGGTEVVAPEPLTRIEDHGQPDAEIIRLDFGGRHILDKP